MKTATSLLGFAVAVLMAVGFSGHATAQDILQQVTKESTLSKIKERGVLQVGHGSFVPWSFRSIEGKYVGFEIDVGRKLAEDMGVEYQNLPTAWDGLIPALISGKMDLIIGGMSPTPKRALTVNFSNSYSPSLHQGFIANKKLTQNMAKLEDFNRPDVTIATRRGTTAEDAARRYLPKATHRLFDDEAMSIQEVLNGSAHGIFSSEPKPTFWEKEFSDQLHKPFGNRPFSEGPGAAIGVRQGDFDMLTYVNNWINWRSAGGFIPERFDYWFGTIEWYELDPSKKKN